VPPRSATVRLDDGRWFVRLMPQTSDALEPFQIQPQRRRLHVVAASGVCLGQDLTGRIRLAAFEEFAARLEHFIRAPLQFRERRPGAVNVGSGAGVAPVQKQNPGPQMDGVFVSAREVPFQPIVEQHIDLPVAKGGLLVMRKRKATWVGHG